MDVKYVDKILSPTEREAVIVSIDELITEYSGSITAYRSFQMDARQGKVSLPSHAKLVENFSALGGSIARIIADCAVSQKFFLISSNDYDKRFARGKLKVILNEGFKRVYGFGNDKNKAKKQPTLWMVLNELISIFPEYPKSEFENIKLSLEAYSKDSWWVDERNIETHMDIDALYESRQEDVVESKVIMESMELVNILLRLHDFITKVHGAYLMSLMACCIKEGEKS